MLSQVLESFVQAVTSEEIGLSFATIRAINFFEILEPI